MNLSTDIAIEKMKVFLKQMGQAIDREALMTILMDEDQVAGRKRVIEEVPSVVSAAACVATAPDEKKQSSAMEVVGDGDEGTG